MKAIGDYVIIEKSVNQVRRSDTGFDLAADKNDRFLTGTVVAASEMANQAGIFEGVSVLYDKFAASPFLSPTGVNLKALRISDIAVVF